MSLYIKKKAKSKTGLSWICNSLAPNIINKLQGMKISKYGLMFILLLLCTLGREFRYLVKNINTQMHVFNSILFSRSISEIHFSNNVESIHFSIYLFSHLSIYQLWTMCLSVKIDNNYYLDIYLSWLPTVVWHRRQWDSLMNCSPHFVCWNEAEEKDDGWTSLIHVIQ